MSSETIEKLIIEIQANIDKAQRDLKKVQGSLGDIGDEATQAGNKVQTSGQKINAILASMKVYALAAAAALGAIGYKAITAAGDAVEVRNMFEAVFKDSAESAEAWAETFSDTVGRSVIETMQTMASFQDTFVPLEFDRTEAAELSKTLTELSADIASFKNTTDEEAAAAIQSALVGNHEAVRKYGIVITEASLGEELLNMGIQETAQTASTQEKVMARLNIIMNSTTDAQGDAAKTAGSYANQMRALKGNISDAMAEAGKEGMDDLTQTIIEFNTWGTSGGYDRMTEGISDIASALAAVADGAAEAAKFVTDFYTVAKVWDKDFERPEGMTDSNPTLSNGGENMFPGDESVSLDLVYLNEVRVLQDDEKVKNGQQLRELNADMLAQTREENDLLKDTNETYEEIANTISSRLSDSSIPGWAGHSDYRRETMGIEERESTVWDSKDYFNREKTSSNNSPRIKGGSIADMSIADIMSIASPSSAMRSTEQSISSTIKAVEPTIDIASLISVNQSGFNTLSQKLDTGFAGVIGAVNNISVGSGGSGSKSSSSSSVSAKDVATVKKVNGLHIIGLHSSNTRGF